MGALVKTSPPDQVRVVVVDDDAVVREGASRVLSSLPGVEVVGMAASAMELAGCMSAVHPQVVVLDVAMPPTFSMEGIEAAQIIRREHAGVGVVILSQHADPEYVLEFLRDGSAGRAYLLKERLGDPAQLGEVIREVAAGGSVLDAKVVDALLEAQRRRVHSRLQGLTAGENEVLVLLASGRSNEGIARALDRSEPSVEEAVGSIFRKLRLSETLNLDQRVVAVLRVLQTALD